MSARADLEIKTAFLERAVETLEAVVREQGDALASLERKVGLLQQRFRAMQLGEDEVGPQDDPPPHY